LTARKDVGEYERLYFLQMSELCSMRTRTPLT